MWLLIFLSSVVVYATSEDKVAWWRNAVIYEVPVASFYDTNGDGIGDLRGLLNRTDYLRELGIQALWLTPFYSTPNKDFGYDISNYLIIDKNFGTMEDFNALVKKLREMGVKLILDFVPNHTSTSHDWFQKSVKNDPAYKDYYVWRNPNGSDEHGKPIPPNNWLSVYGTGSAWSYNEERGQYYLHSFLKEQADLNFANPRVLEEMKNVLVMWMKRGVDGFRLDAASWLFEDQQFRDEPPVDRPSQDPTDYDNLQHIYTLDQPTNIQLIQQFRYTISNFKMIADDSERILILDDYMKAPLETVTKYYGTNDRPGAHFPFNFNLLQLDQESDARAWYEVTSQWLSNLQRHGHWPNWVLGNHDFPRVVSPQRYTEEYVDLLHMIMMTLKGTAVTYYGEELGLESSIVRWDQAVDLWGKLGGKAKFESRTRDPARGPLPWNRHRNGGFTTSKQPWIPISPGFWKTNVEQERKSSRSHLELYKKLVNFRNTIPLKEGDCSTAYDAYGVFYVFRSYIDNPTLVTAINLSSGTVMANLTSVRSSISKQVHLEMSSINFRNNKTVFDSEGVPLPPKTGVVLLSM